ncbi:MAG: response regulator [Herbinix sp.]|nr:response regulator [Herbinix sp.]
MKRVNYKDINALIVDDNEVSTIILSSMLESFKIQTDKADNGLMAVEMSKKVAFDIIFVDHIMPGMDGIQTTKAIRAALSSEHEIVIIALTAEITESIINLYRLAGANDVYEKPLGLKELISLLKIWFPKEQFTMQSIKQEISDTNIDCEHIKTIFENIKDIDYTAGFQNAIGSPSHFMKILEASFNDLQSCINFISNSRGNNSIKQLQMETHKLKNIFSNIGAIALLEETKLLEKIILHGNEDEINLQYGSFTNNLVQFIEKLQSAFLKYHCSVQDKKTYNTPMSDEEYEHCILSTIYYIRRYEYDSIVKELEHLISQGHADLKQEFELTLKDIKDYQYEKALDRMMIIKNKIGNLPISEINKIIKLESSWD